jgi:hypothetical protein
MLTILIREGSAEDNREKLHSRFCQKQNAPTLKDQVWRPARTQLSISILRVAPKEAGVVRAAGCHHRELTVW